jgi:cysteine synthase
MYEKEIVMTTLLDTPTSKFLAPRPTGGQHAHGHDPVHCRGCDRVICANSEYLSLTGSIKERMALRILQQAYTEGKIEPGFTISEATSGNTGIAFAALGRMLGHAVKIFMPDWMSQERVQPIKSYGAEIIAVSKKDGGFLRRRVKTCFCRGNSQMERMWMRTPTPPVRKSGRN